MKAFNLTRKIQISSTLRPHLSIRQTNIQKFENMLCGEIGTLTQFQWECKQHNPCGKVYVKLQTAKKYIEQPFPMN